MSTDHTVVILGAGFSVAAGIPPVHPFLYRMQQAEVGLRTAGRVVEADAATDVLKFRLQAASAAYRVQLDLDNIEDLFSLASAVDPRGSLDEKMQWAIGGTISHFSRAPTVNVRAMGTPGWHAPAHWVAVPGNPAMFEAPLYDIYIGALLGAFFKGGSVGRTTFITFNYDLLLEEALGNLGVHYTYGLMGTHLATRGALPPCCVHPWTKASHDLQLLKLHGSLNWASGGGTQGAPGKSALLADYSAVVAAGRPPVIVPPTWKKTFGGQLDAVWARATLAMKDASRIVVIGFSVPETDVHFRFLLGAGLSENIALQEVWIVNPDLDGGVEKRIRALLSPRMSQRGQIRIVNGDSGYTGRFFSDAGLLEAIGRWTPSMHISWI